MDFDFDTSSRQEGLVLWLFCPRYAPARSGLARGLPLPGRGACKVLYPILF